MKVLSKVNWNIIIYNYHLDLIFGQLTFYDICNWYGWDLCSYINVFLFVYFQLLGGQTTTAPTTTSVSAQSPISETNPPSLSPSNVTQPGALSPGALSQTSQNAGNTNASVSNGNGATSASTCCENGRPIMTDPVSGQTVCSCQYDSARLALSGYSRLPSSSVYGTPYPSSDQNPYPSIGVDSSAFYSPLVSTTKKIYINTESYTKYTEYKQHFYTVFVLDFFPFLPRMVWRAPTFYILLQ